MRNLTIRLVETYVVRSVKGTLTINLDDYPETSDMSELEAKEWIQNNFWDMPSSRPWPDGLHVTLGEELSEMNVIENESYDYESEIDFVDDSIDEDDIFFED